jgi:ATP-dependent DNA helicase RecG
MDVAFIRHIIEEGEGETVEFKSSFTKEVIETIVAFSNTKGGKIIIGCNDAKKIVGITIAEESLQKWQNEVKQNTEPSVFPSFEVLEIENKSIVLITVDEFPLKPVSFKNRYYCRKKNSNHLLTVDEITEMRFISLNYSFDSFPVNSGYHQLDKAALTLFKNRILVAGRYVSNGDLVVDFEKLGLIIDGKLTRAAELLFGTHHTSIHIGRFKSADTIIDDLVIRSPLVLAVDEAMNFIKRNITLSYAFVGELKRVERWQ